MTIRDMLGRSGVVSREDALTSVYEHFVLPDLEGETVSISHALGRVAAEDVRSPVDLPDFNRSTVDGYAVSSGDTFGASEAHAAYLPIVADIPMGSLPERDLAKGETMAIATGGALPGGADAVVMFEHTQPVDENHIEVVKPAAPLENVIQIGDDVREGEVLISSGHVLRPQDMAMLAGVGITMVTVFEQPRVAIISTGNEIIPADRRPAKGQVRDVNSYNLEGLITQAGGVPVKKGIIPDEYARLRTIVEESTRDCRLLLLTGGSSVGTADFTAKVIDDLGPPGVLVHGVSVKPGKPLIAGLVKAAQGGAPIPVFGLPGHPAAVTVCFDLFVRPLLKRLRGESPKPVLRGRASYSVVKAKLARSVSSTPGREDHVRVVLEEREEELWARPVFGASGLISTLVKADGTVVIPVSEIGIEAGEEVEVRLFQ